jgi:hypothetical protein
MQRHAIMGLAVVVVLAVSGLASTTASARGVLDVTETAVGSITPEPNLYSESQIDIATSTGTIACSNVQLFQLTTNNMATDTFSSLDTSYECSASDASGEGEGDVGLTRFTVSAKGKATGTVDYPVTYPAPDQNCRYTGTIKGRNSKSGVLSVDLSGRVTGHDCPDSRATASMSGIHLFGPEFYELEAHVVN